MENQSESCQNCEQPFEIASNFCPNCGQKTNEELTIGVLFYNTISNYFSFDARFLKSFIPLMFKPGYLAKRYLEGKRLLYLHPAQMYLFVSVIFFFVFSFTVNDWIKEADKANMEIAKSGTTDNLKVKTNTNTDSIVLNGLKNQFKSLNNSDYSTEANEKAIDSMVNTLKKNSYGNSMNFGITRAKLDSLRQAGASDKEIYKEMGMDDDAGFFQRGIYKSLLEMSDGSGFGNLIKRFVDTVPIAMFFLLPLFALILKLFYFNKGRYAYHLVFSFYFFSFMFTVLSMQLAFHRFIVEIPILIHVLIVLSFYVYFLMALHKFYKNYWLLSWLKSGLITFIFMIFVLPFSFAFTALFALVNA